MTFDSDSYIRLAALARRSRFKGIDAREPRKNFVLWAHTQWSARHWHINATEGGMDEPYEGAGYHYPLGIAYLIR
jgi:hypothetical protein